LSVPTYYVGYDGKVPHVPSVRRRCSKCGRLVWVDQAALSVADALPIVCAPCAKAIAVLAS
jgi:formylmethanofuran dehydrogenase subunit E